MEIHIGDRVADVTLVSKEGNKVQFMIDGKPYDVDIVMAENGSCSILHDGNSFNAELIRGEGGKSYDVNMFYRSYHVDIVDTQTKYLRMKKGGEERQDDKIVAPMPGKVVKIPVRKGDRLSSGDIVVVLEAMIASYIDYLMNLEENKSPQLSDARPISRWREFGLQKGVLRI